jgi:hypothetical protein
MKSYIPNRLILSILKLRGHLKNFKATYHLLYSLKSSPLIPLSYSNPTRGTPCLVYGNLFKDHPFSGVKKPTLKVHHSRVEAEHAPLES